LEFGRTVETISDAEKIGLYTVTIFFLLQDFFNKMHYKQDFFSFCKKKNLVQKKLNYFAARKNISVDI